MEVGHKRQRQSCILQKLAPTIKEPLRRDANVSESTKMSKLHLRPTGLNLNCMYAFDGIEKRKMIETERIAARLFFDTEMGVSGHRISASTVLQHLNTAAIVRSPVRAYQKRQARRLSPIIFKHFGFSDKASWRCFRRSLYVCLLVILVLPDSASGQSGNATTAPAGSGMPPPMFAPQPSTVTTIKPTSTPTLQPIAEPQKLPSLAPTRPILALARGFYRQEFVVPRDTTSETIVATFYNETQLESLAILLASYTDNIIDQSVAQIEAECIINVEDQQGFVIENNVTVNSIDYSCTWTSSETDNLDFLPGTFLDYVSANLDMLAEDMNDIGLPVVQAEVPTVRTVSSPAPTSSQAPSMSPSTGPTISSPPSMLPSNAPSLLPTDAAMPSTAPNFPPLAPVAVPGENRPTATTISLVVVLSGLAVLGALAAYYFYTKKKQTENGQSNFTVSSMAANSRAGQSLRSRRTGGIFTSPSEGSAEVNEVGANANVVISPTDSLLSNKSMLSAGDSGFDDESGDENDNTKNLQDEFDQYKDQNLELLRQNVEGNLSGFEGIMSAAVTNALMGDEEANVETQELYWGCGPDSQGEEIEASVLFEVSDWLKRNESAEAERKRSFMQEILNRMVRSVRFGVLNAGDGSRTIHESAALLGLQLAEDLPMTTVIISGMRKTTTADDMKKALKEFGDIDVAAVASGRRGFGIVRFRRSTSVDRALRRYRSGEIVILDVSIQMKVLMPSGAVDSR